MEVPEKIIITVAGPTASGKTTLLTEIYLALQRAQIKTGIVIHSDDPPTEETLLLQGRRLDALAAKLRRHELCIELRDITVRRDVYDGDVPF